MYMVTWSCPSNRDKDVFRSDRQSNVKGHQGDDIAQLTQFMLHINGQFVVCPADGVSGPENS